MSGTNHFHEHVLHWLWENRFLQHRELHTNQGKEVVIHHPGYHNQTDGPDFTHARVTIGSLKWHGDVEIHWHSDDWTKHQHHEDPAFNCVILHVVYEESNNTSVSRQDQTSIPTLYLKPFLKKPLQYFFHHYQQQNILPCTGNLKELSDEVIKQQFEQAHHSYFEQKVDDFLQFYDASLPVSKAWKRALITALFDNLGISHNREPMQKLSRVLIEKTSDDQVEDLIQYALQTTGIQPHTEQSDFSWNKKGSRPANRPKNRIKQGCYMIHFIRSMKFTWWFKTNLEEAFSQMMQQITTSPGLGKHQSDVLFGIVWIPAYYLLGDLTGNKKLSTDAAEQWSNHCTKLPKSIRNKFLKAGMPEAAFSKKLGAVHQYRTFCKSKQCQQCEIFHHIISS